MAIINEFTRARQSVGFSHPTKGEYAMIQADFTICKIDGKTIDRSLVYRLLRALRCKRLADRLTYEVTGPKVDDD